MKKATKTMILALVFCGMAPVYGSAATTGKITFSSTVQAGRIQAGKHSRIRLASSHLQNSRIGSSLTMNSRVRIGGPTKIGDKGQFRAGAFEINNGYVADSVTFQSNVQVQGGVTGGDGCDIGMGGVQISTDERYLSQPLPVTSLHSLVGDRLAGRLGNTGKVRADFGKNRVFQSSLGSATVSRMLPGTAGNTSPARPGDRALLFATMSKQAYGGAKTFPGWIKVYDTDTGNTDADRKLRKSGGHAVVYKNRKTGEIVTVFEGTKSPSLKNTVPFLADVDDDVFQRIAPTEQYKAAVAVLENVWKADPKAKMIVTGHSLGGGLAQYAGAKLAIKHPEARVEGIVYNSADLGLLADAQLLLHRNDLDRVSMTHVRLNGDTVSALAGLNVRRVFPRSAEYELPSNDGPLSDHGIDAVIDKIDAHKAEMNQYPLTTTGKVIIGKS